MGGVGTVGGTHYSFPPSLHVSHTHTHLMNSLILAADRNAKKEEKGEEDANLHLSLLLPTPHPSSSPSCTVVP